MTFLQPAMLWSLVALVPLAAIYFLKVRPRRKPTTAYFLWDRIFQEKRASSLFNRLRDAWSLILMLLAAGAIGLALGRPEWADERRDLVIIIDNSASMGAREGRSSRLDLAKGEASAIVEGLNGNQRASVASLASGLTYHSHLTENPRELLEAIDLIGISGESMNLESLPTDSWSSNGKREPNRTPESAPQSSNQQHRLLLITDGGFDAAKLPKHVELLKVGAPLENLGLVAADLAYLAGGVDRLGLYFQVLSTFDESRRVDLNFWHVDDAGKEQLFKVIPLTVEPGTNPPETFQLTDAPAGRWIARLDIKDALAEDDAAFLAVAKPDPVRVAVDSADRFFLENSVQAFSRGDGLLSLVTEQPDVVLAKSTAPAAEFAIVFQPQGESAWWTEIGEEVVAGPARVLVENHPALRHLDAASIPFVGARQLTPVAGAQILVADDHGLPLVYKARHEGRTAVVVNMDPVAAEFYFSAWFPVLVHSAATHLAGRENPLAAAYRPGEAAPIPGGRDDIVTKIIAPATSNDESNSGVEEIKGQWFNHVDRLGFYKLENPSGPHLIAASLLSERESRVGNETAKSNHDPLSRGNSPAQWLTLLAIVVLSAESILYHRRKVG